MKPVFVFSGGGFQQLQRTDERCAVGLDIRTHRDAHVTVSQQLAGSDRIAGKLGQDGRRCPASRIETLPRNLLFPERRPDAAAAEKRNTGCHCSQNPCPHMKHVGML